MFYSAAIECKNNERLIEPDRIIAAQLIRQITLSLKYSDTFQTASPLSILQKSRQFGQI